MKLIATYRRLRPGQIVRHVFPGNENPLPAIGDKALIWNYRPEHFRPEIPIYPSFAAIVTTIDKALHCYSVKIEEEIKTLNKEQVLAIFKADFLPTVQQQYEFKDGEPDYVARSEEWNNFTDMLCAMKVITPEQYDAWPQPPCNIAPGEINHWETYNSET